MLARLFWLSLGTFMIGSEAFLLAGLLPQISASVHSPLAATGQLVTVYALSYAVGSPVLATLFGNLPRKALLTAALATFALANALAALAPSLAVLMLARILMGLSAGVFTPTANAVAVALVPPEMRARAIATVIGGMTIAVAFGAPLGTLLAGLSTWRAPFAIVAAGAALVTLGLALRLPRQPAAVVISIRQRLAMARRPAILVALLSTKLWGMATFVVFVYIAPQLAHAGITGHGVSIALLAFGVGSAAGNIYGGVVADRIGATRSAILSLSALTILLGLIAAAAWTLPAPTAGYAIIGLMLLWGAAGWSFYPSQTTRMTVLGSEAPVIALSLNASALFLGQAGGAALGSLALNAIPLADLGFVGAALAAASLIVLALSVQPRRRRSPVELEIPAAEPAE
jgi:predicted MFS family arabinose efflux permease